MICIHPTGGGQNVGTGGMVALGEEITAIVGNSMVLVAIGVGTKS